MPCVIWVLLVSFWSSFLLCLHAHLWCTSLPVFFCVLSAPAITVSRSAHLQLRCTIPIPCWLYVCAIIGHHWTCLLDGSYLVLLPTDINPNSAPHPRRNRKVCAPRSAATTLRLPCVLSAHVPMNAYSVRASSRSLSCNTLV